MSLGTQLKKGVLEICILAVISNGEIYGYDLIERIQESGLGISEGTLYPLLSRLRQEGLVVSTIKESDIGPSRRYYTISDKGKDVLTSARVEYKSFIAIVNKLLLEK
jgi:PadR family transcriptional regulator PadR